MLNEKDLELLEQKGITANMVGEQLMRFTQGFPFLKLHSQAKVGTGICALDNHAAQKAMRAWDQYTEQNHQIVKFVPASGAASRMFKDLFAFINSGRTIPETEFEKTFFVNIEKFAFASQLSKACINLYGSPLRQLVAEERYQDIVKALLTKEGLNYGALPKAVLKFHKAIGSTAHTPIEEHLEEAARYVRTANHVAKLHFTVSPEHRKLFQDLLERKLPNAEQIWGCKFEVSLSEQKPSTDTVAANLDNTLYHDDEGKLLLRPAGHGALIENLNDLQADVVFVKNIDNVVPLQQRHTDIRSKKILAGTLVLTQKKIAHYLGMLEGECTSEQLHEILTWTEQTLCTHKDNIQDFSSEKLKEYLRTKLNRPIRVCGMVRNEGEPGGGPYLAYNKDGSYSPQILEAAQIDTNNAQALGMMQGGTHFNPVDLVCYVKDYKGQKFDLRQFVDHETGFISTKSKDGIEIKALELPGLWNGAMSDWNTIFVEVPIETFNPVKTVNDLLRPQHQ